MSRWLERLAARLAFLHARRVYRRFERALTNARAAQEVALRRALAVVADSEFAREHDLRRVRTRADLRRALPLMSYEDYRPWIDRTAAGETRALFTRSQRPLMFATSSGTTARQKLIPVTPTFVADYRRGWNTFGLKLLSDHPDAVLRGILQITGRYDETHTSAGIPCGAITGLLARSQKRIVRRFYVSRPELALLGDPQARYYALMRLAATRDVAFAITANPATLIRLAHVMDEQSETLIRDVRDGTLSAADPHGALAQLRERLQPDRQRAGELEQIRARTGNLLPRDAWRISFLACWTGGSLGHYLSRVAELWGPVPIRDIGLMASEGRVSLPLDDGSPAGPLDVLSGCFEFIPADQHEQPQPDTLWPEQLDVGGQYETVLSNPTGLLRYRLGDVVRCTSRMGATPVIEFLHRAGRVASVAGEKLTENQVVTAVEVARRALNLPPIEFLIAPVWDDPPYYRLSSTAALCSSATAAIDRALAEQNDEYASRRKSLRLGPLQARSIPASALAAMDRRLQAERGGATEQYKRPTLLPEPGDDDRMLLQAPQ